MGGYLASREVLTAADRRQTNYASERYSADVCISQSHPSDGRPTCNLGENPGIPLKKIPGIFPIFPIFVGFCLRSRVVNLTTI